jgi:hypothetical protein
MEVTRRIFSAAAVAAAFRPVGSARPLEPLSPGIKISMQVDESVSDEDLTWIKQMGVDYLNVQTGNGRATLENFLAIKKRVEAAGLEHLQQREPQHRGDHAQPIRTRPENRVAETIYSGHGQGWHRLHHVRAHGKWHLVE